MNKVILFYKYIPIPDPESLKIWQQGLCEKLNLKGRIILAREGINGTLGGTVYELDLYKAAMNEHPLFGSMDFKDSIGSAYDFPDIQIKIKREICHLGLDPQLITAADGGEHLSPSEAHELMKNAPEDLIILDGRNSYESRIGAFKGAIKPEINHFREFPDYIDEHAELFKDKQVLMYCTGGIRCERASAYLKSKKIAKKVYQITGGIHRYAEEIPHGYFKGKNYVFDARGALPITSDVISSCDFCTQPYDVYTNCLNAYCNKQIISCPECTIVYEQTCSSACQNALKNGTAKKRPPLRKLPCIQH